jgi:hypothetical protein
MQTQIRTQSSCSAEPAAFDHPAVELLLIFLWTLLIAAPYISLSPLDAPRGIEYYSLIHSNHVWTRFQQCGWCAIWNGSVRGGAPAFVDPHASLLHPLVIVSTLLLGVINGSKLALIVAFFMAGFAQWWLARVLGIGRIARLWSASMAVAAGFLAAQMSNGLFSMVISSVSCALALPPLIALTQTGRRRAAVIFGVLLGLALLAGQGYMQFGLALLAPAALLLTRSPGVGWRILLRRYALAALLALLLAAPFLVPFLHFLPQFSKIADPQFASAQPFGYVLLNLIIDDRDLYHTSALDKLPYPFLYANFIGGVPVALAVWGLGGGRDWRARRVRLALAAFALIALWAASATPLRWIANQAILPGLAALVAGFRNCSLIAGLAIPPILALAALGVDRLLEAPELRRKSTTLGKPASPYSFKLDLRWLLAAPLIFALFQAQQFGKGWIATDIYPADADPLIDALRTPDLQWVSTPLGGNSFEESAIAGGLKLAYGFRAWDWNGRMLPAAALMLAYEKELPNMIKRGTLADVGVFAAPPSVHYAALAGAHGERRPCRAHGVGGAIDVSCDSVFGGELVVDENSWDGWRAWVDDRPAPLKPAPRLTIDLPPGRHTASFRYQPWDVPLGLGLSLLGVALAVYHWRKSAD